MTTTGTPQRCSSHLNQCHGDHVSVGDVSDIVSDHGLISSLWSYWRKGKPVSHTSDEFLNAPVAGIQTPSKCRLRACRSGLSTTFTVSFDNPGFVGILQSGPLITPALRGDRLLISGEIAAQNR
jgi:hypothetical protein